MNRPLWTPARQPESDSCDSVKSVISLSVDGVASADEAQRLEAHLPVCESCRASLLWAQATQRALASRPVVLPPASLQARIAQSLAAAPASLTVRPTRAFILRPAYATAASVSLFGLIVGYGLLHHQSPTLHSLTTKPKMVASSLPHTGIETATPIVKAPKHQIQPRRHILVAPPVDDIIASSFAPEGDAVSHVAPAPRPDIQTPVAAQLPSAPVLRKKTIRAEDIPVRFVKKFPVHPPIRENAPKPGATPENAAVLEANIPKPSPIEVPVSSAPETVPETPQPTRVMTASAEAGGLLGAVKEQAARLRGETVKTAQSGIREAGYGMRTAALDESGTAAITQGKY